MNIENLLKLADLLEADAHNDQGVQFDLNTLGRSKTEPAVSCHTVACGMGIAALSGVFPDLTYHVEPHISGTNVIEMVYKGERIDFSKAAEKLFDIDYYVAEVLFNPRCTTRALIGREGELELAESIRNLVAGRPYN